MLLVWDRNEWEDYLWWQAQHRQVLKRINDEHRLIYKVVGDEARSAACRYHCGR